MKLAIAIAALAAIATPALAQSSYSTRGYVRSDGTYVQPHRSTTPDSTTSNNWSTKPNVNPYTGQQGTRAPTYGSPSGTVYGGNSNYGQPRRNCGYYGC